jgi:MFS family permease
MPTISLDRLGLPALSYGPFRIFFASSLLANVGIFLFMAAYGWFIQIETGSAAMVGLGSAIMGLPWLLLMLHAGMLTDRLGARRLIAGSFVGGGLVMALVAFVALLPEPSVPVVLGAAFMMGVLMTIGAPGSISIVGDLVPPAAVSSAVGLNFLLINGARIVGGLGAGWLLAEGREPGWTILIGAVLFALPGVFIWRLRTRSPIPGARTAGGAALIRPIMEAGGHAIRNPTLGTILLLSAGPGLIGLPYNFLLPVAAVELGIGAEGLGFLLVAVGTGGLVAGLAAEHAQRRLGHGRSILLGLASAATGLIVFGVGPPLPVSIVSVAFVGGGFVVYASASLTLVQALAPPSLRGRLTSVFSLLYWGLMPIGGLLGGLSAEAFSARTTMLGAGVCLVVLGLVASIRRPQVLTLAVSRDGLRMRGNLEGTGLAEPWLDGLHVQPSGAGSGRSPGPGSRSS